MGVSDSTGTDGSDDPESMESGFFKGKRPWSKIKDRILGQYMPPYLAKEQRARIDVLLNHCSVTDSPNPCLLDHPKHLGRSHLQGHGKIKNGPE